MRTRSFVPAPAPAFAAFAGSALPSTPHAGNTPPPHRQAARPASAEVGGFEVDAWPIGSCAGRRFRANVKTPR
ncbi:hypothetical protein BH11PSE8_BH11PSE8_38020 [soil metagenome]